MNRHDPGPAFRALHQRGNPFILANAWDAGSARVLAAMGAQAIGTSSAGYGFTQGVSDMGQLTRDQHLAHAADLVAATDLPVSGDFEDGFGEAPEVVAETIRLAAEAGLAGCCIEDTDLPAISPYDFDLSVERIRAAADAARSLPRDFVLLARADGVMNAQYDLAEAIKRVQAFEAAGADAIYIPKPGSFADLKTVCDAVTVPVNVLSVGPMASYTQKQFGDIGVARISLGSTLARNIHQAILDTAGPMFEKGDFSQLTKGATGDYIDELLAKGARKG